jgi:hypothetical protein
MTAPLKPSLGGAEAEVDRLLGDCRAVPERVVSAKAGTWHRLRGEVLARHGVTWTSRRAIRWTVALGSVCAASLIVGLRIGSMRVGHRSARLEAQPGVTNQEAAVPAPVATEPEAHEGWRRIDLGTVGQLTVSPAASLRLPANATPGEGTYSVGLDSGELCASIAHRDVARQGPFVVEAMSLRVVVVGTRFCVSAGTTVQSSWVSVEDGQVRVEHDGRSATISAGETLHGDDPHLWVSVTPAGAEAHASRAVRSPRNLTSCSPTDPIPQRRRCLWRLSGGDDLAAQNALYLLGLLARDQERDGAAALSIWQTYRHRFARGAMSAEVDLAMLDELIAERRFAEALTVSDDFLDQFGSYFRAGEVSLKRAEVLRAEMHRPAEAEESYRRALDREANPNRRSEALFGLGLCQETLGQIAEAESTWNRYRKEFPRGRHATEVAQRLGGRPTGP